MIVNKLVKNLKWNYQKRKMKKIGKDDRIGIDFSITGNKFIEIGNGFRGGKHIIIDAIEKYKGHMTGYRPLIKIGNNVTLTDNCYISCCNEIVIEDGCLIGPNTFICDNFHGDLSEAQINIRPSERPLYSKGGIHIGANVWIGRNVCIMPGVSIGNGAVVGANSVVTHDVDTNAIVAGVPAKIIKRIR